MNSAPVQFSHISQIKEIETIAKQFKRVRTILLSDVFLWRCGFQAP